MKDFKTALILGLSIGLSLILGARIVPWSGVNWGKIETLPGATITVTGEARMKSLPQIAHFSATVSELATDKDTAVNQVNTVMAQLIDTVKEFGIDEEDIQTQQVSVYEVNDGGPEIMIYPPRPRPDVTSGWQASNSIEITLRDIDQASALADLLQGSGATGVSGPNFTMEDTDDLDAQLLTEAVADAREKAEVIAEASGRHLGKVITVSESGSVPFYRGLESSMAVDVAPTPIEPGSQTVFKTVTVLFELK